MLGVAFAVMVGAIVFAVVARRMQEKRTRAPVTVEAKVPEFQVVALGLQGSGKTLLLAGMYHCLRVPAGQSYFLHAHHRDVLQLNSGTPRWPTPGPLTCGREGRPKARHGISSSR